MGKREINYTEYLDTAISIISNPGALLVTTVGKTPNVMAIGWGLIGIIWSKPIFLVMVRPSRFTYKGIEETGEFTVNIPYPSMSDIVEYCGTYSGRDHDKFAEKSLTAEESLKVKPPIISECAIHYECRVVHKNDVIPSNLDAGIIDEYYTEDDFHRVYFGEILRASADLNFREKL